MEPATPAKDDWQEILRMALQGGDAAALGRLCQDYLRPKAYPFAVSILKNSHDAEDTVQEVFMRLIANVHRIRNHGLESFEAFVITMTKNACIDFKRKQKCTEPLTEEHHVGNSTGEDIARHDFLERVCWRIQRELSPEEQWILELKVLEELPYRVIAEQTGIPQTTLYVYYQTILKKLDRNGELRDYWRS